MDRSNRPVRAAIVVAVVAGVLAPSRRTQKLLIAASVVIGVLAGPAAASARSTADQARETLIQAHLTPTPPYPDILPYPLYGDNTATFTHGHFFVWKGGSNTSPAWFSINYRCQCHRGLNTPLVNATFSRGSVSDIAKAIKLSRNGQGHPVRLVRIHGRWRYRFQTDRWFGYMWKQQGFAYSVFARYSRRIGWTFMRDFVGSLHPLGRLWNGRTSQGTRVRLYLSRGGLDWEVFSIGNCADGSKTGVGIDEDLIGVHHDGTFTDSYSDDFIANDGMLHRSTASMRGRFPAPTGAAVIGSFDFHDTKLHHPQDRASNCGARITWQANPI
ncbi:MAG: hypothetical protein QOF83_578 [Solirubrobacteraceae bacterium]|jgi:hypothetical protein|nr:hypothetical protein [Solirubrobacteraceae bacterium]